MGRKRPGLDRVSDRRDTTGTPAPQALQETIRGALHDGRRLLLALDLDGTLADYAARPQDVTVPDRLRQSLNRLRRDAPRTAVVIVSGRSVHDLMGLLGSEWRSHIVGNHGIEVPDEPRELTPPATWRPVIQELERAWSGLWLEDKGATWAIHYRGVLDRDGVERALRERLLSLEHHAYQARQGHLVVDIVPRHINKGTGLTGWATRQVGPDWLQRFIISMGDDTTDRDLLQVAKGHGLAIQVGSRPGLAPDATLPGPEAARHLMYWLTAELDRLDGGAPPPGPICSI